MLKINEVTRLYLGIQGENAARTLTIDVSDWLVDYPNGSVTIWHKRNGDASPSATGAVFVRRDGIVQWSPTGTDTYVAGEGQAEVRITENGVIKKTKAIRTFVSESVTLAGTPTGSDWQSYINAVDGVRAAAVAAQNAAEAAQEGAEEAEENAEAWAVGQRGGEDVEITDPTYHNNAKYYAGKADEALDETKDVRDDALQEIALKKADALGALDAEGNAIIQEAEQAVAHYPFVNPQTRTWYVWNVAESRWVNTGYRCEGLPGPKGDTGPQGPTGPKGDPGEDGRDAVIIEIGAVEYSFQIDGNGHLILSYGGSEAPVFYIDGNGHLIHEF